LNSEPHEKLQEEGWLISAILVKFNHLEWMRSRTRYYTSPVQVVQEATLRGGESTSGL
jgi:hypothetical protein